MKHSKKGFTIVELLIVIVVIAVLAAITIVAYNGIQDRARSSAAASSSSQASKKIKVWQVDNELTTPSCAQFYTLVTNATDSTSCSFNYKDTNYQYTAGTGGAFCITTTVVNKSYKVSESTTPQTGGCSGHGQNGVAAITNIALNPRGLVATNWFNSIDTGVMTFTRGVTWNSRSDWNRIAFSSAGSNTGRLYLNLSDLENGQTYNVSVSVGNDTASSISNVSLDFCDQGVTLFSLAPGEQKRVSLTGTRATYDNTFRFIDVGSAATSASFLITDIMVTKGSSLRNFADGSSPNWIWNGTANAATSTGPPL